LVKLDQYKNQVVITSFITCLTVISYEGRP